MKRSLVVVALLIGAAATNVPNAMAQAPAATTPGSAKLLGNWEGTYTTDGPSGAMTVGIAKEGTAWKLTNALDANAPPAGELREIAVDGDKVTWKQMFGEYDVTFKGALSTDGAQLTGTLEATQGGSPVGGGTFTLARKKA